MLTSTGGQCGDKVLRVQENGGFHMQKPAVRNDILEARLSPSIQNQAQSLTGGCQCGAVRYMLSAPPSQVYVCHCRECQLQSASAFGISAIVAPTQIKITQGAVKAWARSISDGGEMPCHFCPDCGTRLFHGDLDGTELVSVKGGSLDIQPDLNGAMHIWAKRKLKGVIIPKGVAVFDEEPEI